MTTKAYFSLYLKLIKYTEKKRERERERERGEREREKYPRVRKRGSEVAHIGDITQFDFNAGNWSTNNTVTRMIYDITRVSLFFIKQASSIVP